MRFIFPGAIVIFGLCRAAVADMSHDQALEAVKSGKIVPVLPIIERAEREYTGQVVEVELTGSDAEDPGMFYKIKILTSDGRLLELLVDATTGNVVGLGGRGIGLQ